MLYIIFCAISESIYTGFDAEITDIVLMAVIMFCIHSATLIVVWYFSGIGMVRNVQSESIDSMEMRSNVVVNGRCSGFDIYDRIAILFCSTQKTVAFGIPIVTSLYESSADLGIFLVPLLLFYPMMLIMDSLLVQPLAAKVVRFEKEMEMMDASKSQEISTWTA